MLSGLHETEPATIKGKRLSTVIWASVTVLDSNTIMSHHFVEKKTYYAVFGALIFLLIITYGASLIDVGEFLNLTIALVIATIKAILILLFFMQVKYATPLRQCFAASGFMFLAILFTITFADYIHRGPWDDLPSPDSTQTSELGEHEAESKAESE
ncbi:cytochrome C oxidase subunit IV family protein [Thalassoroseus pseudoceratinae]|uniref:cytochrome C oxidase subunit IV family protein n=1 Tax=Thalassoroseus pseudoceratinae TaxID=2713176 RepID=UPI00141DF373|nr:cytochrome C oxidase subunit IV family protein [Thalassoroseus pseudoceratinae]